MKQSFAATLSVRLARRLVLPLVAAAVLAPASHADRIVLDNKRTLEGVIQSQNDFYININVSGTLVPVPRKRIKEFVIQKPNENVRLLLDKANEAIRRNETSIARSALEQARAINTNDQKLREEISKADRKVIDLERSGGTPEERRRRAQDLLREANEAYDRVQVDVGNDKLIEALRTDPTYEPAHQLIDQRMNQGSRPNLMLAAEYFANALTPDSIKADNPVVPLLPKIYVELANRFGETTDIDRANRYYDLLNQVSAAFAAHPDWAGSDPVAKRIVDMPFNELMADLIGKTLNQGQYQLATDKLHIWTPPSRILEANMLYARAYIGQKNYAEAEKLLEQIAAESSGSNQLQVQAKAAKRLVEAQQSAEAGKIDDAIATLETVFYTSEQLIPEIHEAVGQMLAAFKASKLKAGISPNPWLPAEVAALNLRFGADQRTREDAYSELHRLLAYVPWRLNAAWMVNGNAMNVPTAVNGALCNALSDPLNIQFNSGSPFVLRAQIDLGMSAPDAQTFMQAIETGNKANFPQPVNITGFKMTLEASYPALPTMLNVTWTAESLLPEKDKAKGIHIPLATANDVITILLQKEMARYVSPEVHKMPQHLKIELPAQAAAPQAAAATEAPSPAF